MHGSYPGLSSRICALLLLALGFPVVATAQFALSTNNGVIEISYYTGTDLLVEVPAMTNGYPVASIGNYAFQWKTVTNVVLPSGITNIGKQAFAYCYSLRNVNIPDGVLSLGDQVFYQCTGLSGIFIPQSVTNIGGTPFSACPNLAAIDVDPNNPAFAADQGVLFNKSLTTLIECPSGKTGVYVVPDGTTNIMVWAFGGCPGLTSITLPESVTDLGSSAFYHCWGLTNMVIPNKVSAISQSAFQYCTNLVSLSLGTNVAKLEQDSFASCYHLASVVLPDSVQNVGWNAFGGCFDLQNVEFGTNVTLIGPYAFDGCGQLTNVWLPDSLQTILKRAFENCSSLTSVHFGRDLSQLDESAFYQCYQLNSYDVSVQNTNFQSADGVLFNRDFTTLLRCPFGRSGSYQVPDGVTKLGASAFYNCTGLTRIILPDSVKKIDHHAFENCTDLVSVAIPAGVTNVEYSAFIWCGPSLTSVLFAGNPPSGMDDTDFYGDSNATIYYLPGTTGWSTNFCGRPAVLWNPQPQTGDPSFGVQPDGFSFRINGSEDIPFLIEACTNLAGGTWMPIETNVLTGGTIDFHDGEWTNHSSRFYRISWP